MSVKRTAERFLTSLHLDAPARDFVRGMRGTRETLSWWLLRRGGRLDRAMIREYLAESKVKKLHIGCAGHLLDGWLNTDLFADRPTMLHLDATRPFPFADGDFDYVFSSHMIEHIVYTSGLFMLRECHRILKPGGRLRISTPDLQFLVDLHRQDKSALQRAYIKWSAETIVPPIGGDKDTFVINSFVRQWGHLFIYDEQVLRASLQAAGFVDIVRCQFNQSADPVLACLENEAREPDGFLALESLTLEASK